MYLHGPWLLPKNIKEPLIKSGRSRLRFKMFGIKARIARERAIAKICNADTGH